MLAAQAIKAGDAQRRRRRRAGVDVERAVLRVRHAQRREARRSDDGRRHDQGWALVLVLRRAHGRPRRVHGEEGGHHARSSRTSSRCASHQKAIAAHRWRHASRTRSRRSRSRARRAPTVVDTDEGPRARHDRSRRSRKLRPAFPTSAKDMRRRAHRDRRQRVGRSTTARAALVVVERGVRAGARADDPRRGSPATRRAAASRATCSSRRSSPCRT